MSVLKKVVGVVTVAVTAALTYTLGKKALRKKYTNTTPTEEEPAEAPEDDFEEEE